MSAELDLAYLAGGCLGERGMRPEVTREAPRVAQALVAAGVDVTRLDLATEHLARLAQHLGDDVVSADALADLVRPFELPPPVEALLRAAAPQALDADALAALAVHLVDIVEAAALQVFIPELPQLTAKSDRTGDDARRVGKARFLRG